MHSSRSFIAAALDFCRRVGRALRALAAAPFLWLIRLYQKTLSPDHGPLKRIFTEGYCKFTPTCSQYTHEAIEKYGVLSGTARGLWRILRCNPCSHGGVDQA